jgi:serine/threonine protein kinase
MVHLDIKPQNVMVSKAGEVKLTDFGISRTIKEQLAARTEAQAPVGTLCYMAPEQLRGEVCDRRTDIYAVGIMIYQLLMGNFPFPTATREEIVAWHLGPGFKSTAMPSNWYDIVQHCVARGQSDRFSTCAKMSSALSGQSVDSSDDASSSSRREITNLISLADAELQGGSPSGAEKYYLRVLEIDPKNTEAWFGRLKIYLSTCNPYDSRLVSVKLNPLITHAKSASSLPSLITDFCLQYTKKMLRIRQPHVDCIYGELEHRLEMLKILAHVVIELNLQQIAKPATQIAKALLGSCEAWDGAKVVCRTAADYAETTTGVGRQLQRLAKKIELSSGN